jgi:hypothetical protein
VMERIVTLMLLIYLISFRIEDDVVFPHEEEVIMAPAVGSLRVGDIEWQSCEGFDVENAVKHKDPPKLRWGDGLDPAMITRTPLDCLNYAFL